MTAFLSDGSMVEAEAAVLALGAPAPATPAPVRGLLGSSRYVADPVGAACARPDRAQR